MGLTVLSPVSTAASAVASAGPATAAGLAAPAAGLPADFAALLAQFGNSEVSNEALTASLPTEPPQATDSPPAELAALLSQLAGNGISSEQLAQMVSGKRDALPEKSAKDSAVANEQNTLDPSAFVQNILPTLPPVAAQSAPVEPDQSSDETALEALTGLANKLLPDGKKGNDDARRWSASTTAEVDDVRPAGGPSNPNGETIATGKTDKGSPPLPGIDLRNNPLTPAKIAVDVPPEPPVATPFSAALNAASTAQQEATKQLAGRTEIPTALHDQQWGRDFGDKIVWLAKNDQQVAQININPPQLGPLQINLSLNGDQASATFTSPHAEVRQAIQDALPHLREMLSASGISLGQANVGAQLPQQNRENPAQFANGTRSSNENAILPSDNHSGTISGMQVIQRGRGLVDLFA